MVVSDALARRLWDAIEGTLAHTRYQTDPGPLRGIREVMGSS